MVTRDDAAATKKDIGLLMGEMGKMYDAMERWKNELKNSFDSKYDGLKNHFDSKYDRLKDYFDLTVENIRYDLVGANRDEIEMIKDRVGRLEKHAGLAV